MPTGPDARGEHVSMLSDPPGSCKAKSPEWIPDWLRKLRILSLAIFCIVFAACLEVLDIAVRRSHGLSTDSRYSNIITAVRYLPTIGIVILGFGWKAISSDAKKITPWAAMSNKWSRASHSVDVDYITGLEPLSLYQSLQRKHWAVSVALVFSFVCGGLVAVANSLSYVDLFASHSEGASLSKTTVFSFTGVSGNSTSGRLPIPLTHLAQQPYAAVAAERLPNGQSAPWTKDSYVFESITNTTAVTENSTLQASVNAFIPAFACQIIDFAGCGDYYIRANVSRRPELNCPRDIIVSRPSSSNSGLLNVTACNEDQTDIRLLSSLSFRDNLSGNHSFLHVMCTPQFATQSSTVYANRTTGNVIDYTLGPAPPDLIDIQTSMLAVYIYLINPVDTRTQAAFGTKENFFMDDTPPMATWDAVMTAVSSTLEYHIDPFTSLLTDNLAQWTMDSYKVNPEKYRSSVEGLANAIMAQTVTTFARGNSSEPLTGQILTVEPRIFLRQVSLRTLQAFLVIIAVVCILELSVLRPGTVLREDPSSLAAITMILAASEREVEDKFAHLARFTKDETQRELDSTKWRLILGAQGNVTLEAILNGPQDCGSTYKENTNGYSPLSLRLWAKLSVLIAISVVMVVLATLMALSRTQDGLGRNTTVTADAFAFAPTVILLLLGYACSGIDGSIKIMAPYRSLWNGYAPTKKPLLYKHRDAPSIFAPIRAIKHRLGVAVAASSFALLLIPAIKIVAAGLYDATLIQTDRSIQTQVDTSLVDNVLNAFDMLNHPDDAMDAAVERASQYTEWSMTPQFNVPVRSGILDNLVFSNLTDLIKGAEKIDLSSSEITINVPALSVDVWCDTADVGVRIEAHNCTNTTFWIELYPDCTSAACDSAINGSSPYFINKRSIITATFAGPDALSGIVDVGTASCRRNRPPRLQGRTYVDWDQGYQALLVNWTNILGGVANTTAFDPSNTNEDSYIVVDPSTLNVSLPTMLAAKCHSNLTRITVDATFRPAVYPSPFLAMPNVRPNTPSLWNPTSYNASSIHRIQRYNDDRSRLPPYWLAPHTRYTASSWLSMHFPGVHQSDGTKLMPGILESDDSLWPTRGSSTSFWQLLAAYAEYELGDPTAVASVTASKEAFADAAKAVYVRYATNLLTEMRVYAARNLSAEAGGRTGKGSMIVEGKIRYSEARIVQDLASTVALECLLGVMLGCLGWVAMRFPSRAILPKSPGSIAARASLLAGSRIVDRLRSGEGMVSASDSGGIWSEKAGLGWWFLPAVPPKVDAHAREPEEDGVDEESAESDTSVMELHSMEDGDVGTQGSDTEYGEGPSSFTDRHSQPRRGDEDVVQSNGSSSITQEDSFTQKPTLRWGIDVGVDVVKGRWTQLPSHVGG